MGGEGSCDKDFLRATVSEIKPRAIPGGHAAALCLAAHISEAINFI